jgi:hypothetical protein
VGAQRASLFLYQADQAGGNQLACIIADGIRLQDPIRLQLDEADPSLLGVAGASANELALDPTRTRTRTRTLASTPTLTLALALALALTLTHHS